MLIEEGFVLAMRVIFVICLGATHGKENFQIHTLGILRNNTEHLCSSEHYNQIRGHIVLLMLYCTVPLLHLQALLVSMIGPPSSRKGEETGYCAGQGLAVQAPNPTLLTREPTG
jgi:hypothetical protein